MDDAQNRYVNWRRNLKADGFRRSDSNPRFFRMTSRNQWIRDDSKFRGRSGSSLGSQARPGAKPGERLESELFKRVEGLEKENATMKEMMAKMKEAMDIHPIYLKNVEERILNKSTIVYTKYVGEEMDTVISSRPYTGA